jgi:hypothetical protein
MITGNLISVKFDIMGLATSDFKYFDTTNYITGNDELVTIHFIKMQFENDVLRMCLQSNQN